MKFLFFSFLFSLISVHGWATSVFYDTATCSVQAWAPIDPAKYIQDNPGLSWIYVQDADPLLLQPIHKLKVVESSLSMKSTEEIEAEENKILKQKLSNQISGLIARINFELDRVKYGFDVSVTTKTLNTQILTLKSQYDAIP